MDSAGRLVLPKAARERAQLVPGMPLDIRVVDGRIEIEPAAASVTLEQRSGFWVATPADAVPVLTQEQVDDTAEALRVPLRGTPRGDD
ncbi:MAG: AbrB/MazE/SpoVT family DNA-binding domain-containing protein [Vicinamibacterales bacterium]